MLESTPIPDIHTHWNRFQKVTLSVLDKNPASLLIVMWKEPFLLTADFLFSYFTSSVSQFILTAWDRQQKLCSRFFVSWNRIINSVNFFWGESTPRSYLFTNRKFNLKWEGYLQIVVYFLITFTLRLGEIRMRIFSFFPSPFFFINESQGFFLSYIMQLNTFCVIFKAFSFPLRVDFGNCRCTKLHHL